MYHVCCTGFLVTAVMFSTTTTVHLPDPFCCFHPLCCVLYILYFNTHSVSLPYLALPSHYHSALSNFYHYSYYLCLSFLLQTLVQENYTLNILPSVFYHYLSNLATSFPPSTCPFSSLFSSSSLVIPPTPRLVLFDFLRMPLCSSSIMSSPSLPCGCSSI